MDIETTWTQEVDYGSMKGRSIEIIQIPSISYKSADLSRKTYLSLDETQRNTGQYFARKYICFFKCNSNIYAVREKLNDKINKKIPISVALTQLAEIYMKNGLPQNFYHGEPTVNSLYIKKVNQPLKHSILIDDKTNIEYESRDVLQVDYGMTQSGITALQKKGPREVILENDKFLYIHPQSEYEAFLTEYPKVQLLGFHFFANSLLSLYDPKEQKPYSEILTGPIGAKTLKEAFHEMKGRKLRKDVLQKVVMEAKPFLEEITQRERLGNFYSAT